MAWQYDPQDLSQGPDGVWTQLPDMATGRWYPAVLQLGNDTNDLIVAGGSAWATSSAAQNLDDYEVWRPGVGWVAKPAGASGTNNCGLNDLRRWCGISTASAGTPWRLPAYASMRTGRWPRLRSIPAPIASITADHIPLVNSDADG